MSKAGSYLIGVCDKLCRSIVLLRARGRCEICGIPVGFGDDKADWLEWAHIIGRGSWAIRWNPKNGLGICTGCHNDKTIMGWLEENDPARYEWVIAQKQKTVSHRDIDLHAVKRGLEMKLLYQ